jgi:hypothetical protein
MKRPYYIVAPDYRHNSAGVRALYELRRHLVERGFEARCVKSAPVPPDAIVVYPETVPGNPLDGKTVARLVLNYPGLLSGDKEYAPGEMVFAYAPRFYSGVPVLTVPVIEDCFCDVGLPRSGGCFWVGKGKDVPRIPETDGLVEITADWPADRRSLAMLFNTKEVFYSYDDCTALVSEARRCGCRVVIVPGGQPGDYDELIAGFPAQLDDFIRITQEAAQSIPKVAFGVLVNDPLRLANVFQQSEVNPAIKVHIIKEPTTATSGLNKLLGIIEAEGADVAVLAHQDMYFRQGWLEQLYDQLALLPDSWVVAGVVGKDMQGRFCGQFQDMRTPLKFWTMDIHEFPQQASCFDEAVIIINLRKGFRFDETLKGFDLYGTLCVLQAWEQGGTAWVLDAFCEHFCTRPNTWHPDETFRASFKWLYRRFPGAPRIDSTVFGAPKEEAA